MPKVLFHHLAKTAGTSLLEHISEQLGPAVCNARYDHEFTDEVMTAEKFSFYHGHLSFRTVERFRLLNPDAFIFTFVRHPVNRVLSQYYNWIDKKRVEEELEVVRQRAGSHRLFQSRKKKFRDTIFNMSLDDFLGSKDADVREVVFNHQSGYLSDETENDNHRRLTSAVVNVLKSYNFVGITELFEFCLPILQQKTGLSFDGFERRSNTNDGKKREGRYDVTRRQLEALVALNSYDLAVFFVAYTRLLKDHGKFIQNSGADLNDLVALPNIR